LGPTGATISVERTPAVTTSVEREAAAPSSFGVPPGSARRDGEAGSAGGGSGRSAAPPSSTRKASPARRTSGMRTPRSDLISCWACPSLFGGGGGGPDLVGAWTPERITFFSERGRGLLGEEGDRKRDMRGGFPEAEIVCRQPVPFAPAVTSSVSSVSDSTANSSRASPLLPELDAWTSALNRWQGDDRRRLEKVVAVEIL
jgi:hypothetical protein